MNIITSRKTQNGSNETAIVDRKGNSSNTKKTTKNPTI